MNFLPGGDRPRYLRLLLREISQNIGWRSRVDHFGRPMGTDSLDANAMTAQPRASGVFMPMIQRNMDSNDNRSRAAVVPATSNEKSHVEIPMRVSAAAIILCAIGFEMRDDTYSDVIPVALSLLDNVQSIKVAVGALISISVIEAATYSCKLGAIPSFVKKYGPVLTSLLEGAIRMVVCEEPTFLTLVCSAQSRWIRLLGRLCTRNQFTSAVPASAVSALARKSASDLLIAIGKQVRAGGGGGNDKRIAGAFVAGINPLLAQLADFPESASVEIARIGLAAMLLPLVGWSGIGLGVRSAQILALAGMISLMNGSYPVMSHNGKKIMTALFLLLDRADKDATYLHNSKETKLTEEEGLGDSVISTVVTSNVTLHSAAVALALCGGGAEDILNYIMTSQSTKKQSIDRCLEIQANAKLLTVS
jgi:hypothetical protein